MLFPPQDKDKTYSIGLDASLTSFGVYCHPIGHEEWYGFVVQSTARDGNDTTRVLDMASSVIESIDALPYRPAIAGIEDYGPINRTSGKVAQRAELIGILKHHLLRVVGIPLITVPPKSLKSYATGNGNSGKEDMLTAANKQGYYPDTHDEADAFFAARAAATLHKGQRIDVSFARVNP